MKKGFLDFFPTPKFLDIPFVGLSISGSAIHFIEFVKKHGQVTLGNYGEKKLSSGAIVEGYIKNPQEIIKALKDLRPVFGSRFVKATLPEERSYLFKTKIPKVAENEIRSSIEFTIEENVPITLAEAVFDYTLLSAEDPAEDKLNVMVSVLPSQIVLSYINVLEGAGLVPLSLEIESQAIARALVHSEDKRTHLIVHFEKNKTGLYIVCNGVVEFSSTLSSGENPSQNDKQINVRESVDAIALRDEIKKISLYWETNHGHQDNKKIERVIVCGEIEDRKETIEYVRSSLKASIELANVWSNIFSFDSYIPKLPHKDSFAFAPAVGLALISNSQYHV
jgi:Tfp pilus assembly PilM family ATPase